jgi:cbb3-type cytochrome oxidase subunit 3
MYREFFSRSPLLALPLVALVIFLVVFVGVLVSVLRRRAHHFDDASRMALDDANEVDHG